METTVIKKFKLGLISLSAFTVLAACGDTTEQTPDTEDPQDTTENVTDDMGETGDQAGDQTDDQADDQATDDTGSADTTAGILNVEFEVALEDAVQTFYDTFGEDVNIDQVEFDSDMGDYHYDIQGWDNDNEYDMEVSADTGEIIRQDTEADNDTDDDMLDIGNYILPAEAMSAAADVSNSDHIEGWSLDIDDGRAIYEIDFQGEDDIDVDAETGEIVDR